MKHLTIFETTAAYEAAESSLILPNVSLTVDNNAVHYNPSSPTPPTPIIDGHEYVDLGLPSGTKWAKYNVGATSETEYGNYYQYGKGAAQYAATSGGSYYNGMENPLATSADTAAQVWGGQWHMPRRVQLNELLSNTTYEWATINGVNGGKFTAQNGNYIFIPAAGSYENGISSHVSDNGFIWSSTTDDAVAAYRLSCYDGGKKVNNNKRMYGFSVRAVVG